MHRALLTWYILAGAMGMLTFTIYNSVIRITNPHKVKNDMPELFALHAFTMSKLCHQPNVDKNWWQGDTEIYSLILLGGPQNKAELSDWFYKIL